MINFGKKTGFILAAIFKIEKKMKTPKIINRVVLAVTNLIVTLILPIHILEKGEEKKEVKSNVEKAEGVVEVDLESKSNPKVNNKFQKGLKNRRVKNNHYNDNAPERKIN